MKTVIDKANTRGYFNHGWLKTYHTFSFADYYNPRRIHFGALRVLNDDTVAPGEGFGMHPHKNMEVVSIPLLMEFCDPETFQIILAVSREKYDIFTLKELLPFGFGPDNLKKLK